MRSTNAERRRAFLRAILLATIAFVACAGTRAQEAAAQTPAGAPPESAPASVVAASDARAGHVEAALEKLRKDPLLSGKHKAHTLRWKTGDEARQTKSGDSLPQWFASLARFLNDTSRLLLWGILAVLMVLLLVSARRLVQWRGLRPGQARASAVSHVRDLDVRPQSLPDDVGAAAWALWQAGQVPAALSLLYRGALSRLIHEFRVPIASSTTEGECLDLAQALADPGARRYVAQVVRAREANIYGGRTLSMAMGEALCSGFAQRLDAAARTAAEHAA